MVQTWNKARRGGNDVLDGGRAQTWPCSLERCSIWASSSGRAQRQMQRRGSRKSCCATTCRERKTSSGAWSGCRWGAGVPAGAAGSGCGRCVPGAGGVCGAGRRSGAGAGGAARVLRRSGRYKPDQLARAGAVTCPGCRGVRLRPVPGDCGAREWGAALGWICCGCKTAVFEKSDCSMKKFI